jgi:hypothetical protein
VVVVYSFILGHVIDVINVIVIVIDWILIIIIKVFESLMFPFLFIIKVNFFMVAHFTSGYHFQLGFLYVANFKM